MFDTAIVKNYSKDYWWQCEQIPSPLNKRTVGWAELEFSRDLHFHFDVDLKEAFALFDRVGGGVIRTRDLAFVMRSIGYQTTPVELEQMIREADQDGQ